MLGYIITAFIKKPCKELCECWKEFWKPLNEEDPLSKAALEWIAADARKERLKRERLLVSGNARHVYKHRREAIGDYLDW